MATSHREAAGDEVEGGETNDEVRRAHKRVDDEDSRVETSEDETTTATPHAPQSMPLEGEWIEQTSGGTAELTVRELDHPDENAETRNLTRPPEDPGDATDDDVRHPDEPTEPPDDAESARVRGSEERVEARVSRAPRGRADEMVGPGGDAGAQTDSGGDEGVPGSAEVDPEDPGGATNSREVVEAEPGGETADGRDECVAHGDAYTEVDEEAGEQRRDAQVEGESARTRQASEQEGKSASTHGRTTTKKTISAPPETATTYLGCPQNHLSHQM